MAAEKVLQSRIAVALNRSLGAIKSRLKVLRAAAQKNVEPRSYQCARNASLSMSVLGAKRKAFASIELFRFDPRPTSVAIASIIADTTEAERNVDALGSSLTPKHLMDYEQAAAAPLPVSRPGVEIAGMPM
jgi:hypothetical protein